MDIVNKQYGLPPKMTEKKNIRKLLKEKDESRRVRT